MTLSVGTNSYLSRADADAYFDTHVLSSVWTSFTGPQRDSGLASATAMIDDKFLFNGVTISALQGLAWPRQGADYLDPKTGRLTATNDEPGGVPRRVTRATAELAMHLLRNPSAGSGEATFDRIKVGPIEIEDSRGAAGEVPDIPPVVYDLLVPLTAVSSRGNAWWRSN
jgi:hypothetical protein